MPVCGPGTIVDVEYLVVFIVREQLDVLATVVDQAFQIAKPPAVGMPAREKVITANLPGELLGERRRFGFQKFHFELCDFVQSNMDNRSAAMFRDKCLAVEEHPLQHRVRENHSFGK